jgi:hypothetical protein
MNTDKHGFESVCESKRQGLSCDNSTACLYPCPSMFIRGLNIFLLLVQIPLAVSSSAAPLEYNRDVRPILSENCFACHGPDSASRKGKLRLDHFEDATASREKGKPAITPGKPDESEAIHRVFTTDEDDLMPPAKSHKVLKPEEKEILKRWIAEGAKYQPHWSLIAPVRPALPKVKDKSWARNPFDFFILARLEAEGLKPAPEADKRSLARRVSLDLIGLPPKPEEVDAFVNDGTPKAYEKFVDRLLASPHWGEHRGRYWLDAARYADTHGIHFDNFREIWAYRDWVINVFNRNEPFDQFTIEQLAGDLLPNATLDQKIATGFNRCNITTSEGGAIDEEYLVLYARDRTETTSQVWLGLTAGCAVCHDHKYDPLKQKEFYQLSAFFNNTTQKAMDGNVKDTPPVLIVTKAEDRLRWEQLLSETNVAGKQIEQRTKDARRDFEAWLAKPSFEKADARLPKDAPAFHALLSERDHPQSQQPAGGGDRTDFGHENTNVAWQEGVVSAKAFTTGSGSTPAFPNVGDFERDQPFSYAVWIRATNDNNGAVFARMEDRDGKKRGWEFWLDGLPMIHIVHDWPGDMIKVMGRNAVPKNQWTHICVTYDGSSKAEGVRMYLNGEPQALYLNTEMDKVTGSIRTGARFKIGQRETLSALNGIGVQDLRLYERVLSTEEVQALMKMPRLKWLAMKSSSPLPSPPSDGREGEDHARTKAETDELYSLWLETMDGTYQEKLATLKRLTDEQNAVRARGTIAHVMNESTNAPEAYLLSRGEYDKRRDKVTPEIPSSLPAMPAELPRNRLGLAQWLMRPEHPLTARVTVNRFWQEIFGTGLVKTSGDFGVAGEMPSHPELLDWLAVEFRESGWNVKKFFRLLVTSATYRQAATVTPEKISRDPQNRLLSRGPHFRMDAEMIRDCALAASGLLVDKIGGASVKPYQPDGVWKAVAIPLSDTSKYIRDDGEKLYRRSLYTFWKRSAPPAQMEIFNAPSREACAVRRERTDTPLQALVTLNDEQFVEAARHLAQHAIKDGGQNEAERLDFMARRLLARTFRPEEKKIVANGLKDLLLHYQSEPREAEALLTVGESKPDASLDKPTLAAYTMIANELMNLDEVLNK